MPSIRRKLMSGPNIYARNHPNVKQHLTMDNISGSIVVDETPNGNDGTNTNGSFVSGNRGDSLKLVGSESDRVTFTPFNAGDTKGAYTFWLKINTDDAVHRIYHLNNFSLNKGFNLVMLTSNKLRILHDPDGASSTSHTSTGTITVSSGWVFVRIQSTGTTWEIYFDESLDSSLGGVSGKWLDNLGASMDRCSLGGVDFDGGPLWQGDFELDDFRYINTDLTVPQGAALFNNNLGI